MENSQGNATVLIIDDSQDELDLHHIALEPLGYNVITAASGKAGQSLIAKAKPDVIFLDMNLGDMTGSEFVQWLGMEFPDIKMKTPIIILSGTEQAPNCFFTEFMRKPVDLELFHEKVRYYVALTVVNRESQ